MILEIWTDGTITPEQALGTASKILIDHLRYDLWRQRRNADVGGRKRSTGSRLTSEAAETPIENLDLSVRVFNSLKRTGITTVGDVLELLEKGDEAVMSIRNFGEKSLDELRQKMQEKGFLHDEKRYGVRNMRHQVAGYRLRSNKDQRNGLRRTLINQLFTHERIQTTRAKAMAIRGEAEKLITLARNSGKGSEIEKVNARRWLLPAWVMRKWSRNCLMILPRVLRTATAVTPGCSSWALGWVMPPKWFCWSWLKSNESYPGNLPDWNGTLPSYSCLRRHALSGFSTPGKARTVQGEVEAALTPPGLAGQTHPLRRTHRQRCARLRPGGCL